MWDEFMVKTIVISFSIGQNHPKILQPQVTLILSVGDRLVTCSAWLINFNQVFQS
jgi:hypothetical protein